MPVLKAIGKGLKAVGKVGGSAALDHFGLPNPLAEDKEQPRAVGLQTTVLGVIALAFAGAGVWFGRFGVEEAAWIGGFGVLLLLGVDPSAMAKMLRVVGELRGDVERLKGGPWPPPRNAPPPPPARALHATSKRLVDVMADAITAMEGETRNNNPGNLRGWDPTLPKDSRGFDVFPTLAAGRWALLRQIDKNVFQRKLTLREFFGGKGEYPGYAPASDGNDPVNYAQFVARRLNEAGFGVGLDDRLDEAV